MTVVTIESESRVIDMLKEAGISKGQIILDFSCGYGMYTIPAAKIAGKLGGSMSKVVEVTDQNFEVEVLKSNLPTEVDFWAPWCGPCRMVSPIYDKLSEEYEGRFKFCKINVDENQETAREYQIMSIPMQMFFVNGEKVDEILGAVPEHIIRTMVDGILQSSSIDDKD